ncbi:MAG: RHS repeat-associated core domain-containing protein [Patescibacteria group bacterium]
MQLDYLSGANFITNDAKQVEEFVDYFPFGGVRVDNKAGAWSEQRKFTGHENDATGLIYMKARYQDPTIGRFLSEDPAFWDLSLDLKDPQAWNSYAYARNNPISYIDPDGKFAFLIPLAAYATANSAWIAPVALMWTSAATLAVTAPLVGGQAYSYAKGDYVTGDRLGEAAMTTNMIAMTSVQALMSVQDSVPRSQVRTKSSNPSSDAKRIGNGHAYDKHVAKEGQFSGIATDKATFSQHIDYVMKNPTETKMLQNGRYAYWQESTNTVIIRDPRSSDMGTAFQPKNGKSYFDNLK